MQESKTYYTFQACQSVKIRYVSIHNGMDDQQGSFLDTILFVVFIASKLVESQRRIYKENVFFNYIHHLASYKFHS